MRLKVIKEFIGKEEGKTLLPGDTLQSVDIDRINTLVGRGYCEIVSLDDATDEDSAPEEEEKKSKKSKKEA